VTCISETIRDRVASGGLYPHDRMEIVYPGVGAAAINASGTFERFFLLPGRIMWTKNIELAISAFKLFLDQAPAELRNFRLHIAGGVDSKSVPYHQYLLDLSAGIEQITFETTVSDNHMKDLYRRCWAVLAPAFNEDFGITPVEGMAHGKPTVACNRGGLRETTKDGVTGYLIEPKPACFAAAFRRLAQDEPLTRTLGAAAAARATDFTWEEFVHRIDDRLEQLVQRP
jgi:glycosyltransferase involved in cell wall biosynthesis